MRELNELETATVSGGVGRVKSGTEASPTTDTTTEPCSGGDKVGTITLASGGDKVGGGG